MMWATVVQEFTKLSVFLTSNRMGILLVGILVGILVAYLLASIRQMVDASLDGMEDSINPPRVKPPRARDTYSDWMQNRQRPYRGVMHTPSEPDISPRSGTGCDIRGKS